MIHRLQSSEEYGRDDVPPIVSRASIDRTVIEMRQYDSMAAISRSTTASRLGLAIEGDKNLAPVHWSPQQRTEDPCRLC